MDSSPLRELSFRPSPPPPPPGRDHRFVQWEKWSKEIIPQLVPLFITLVRESSHFRYQERTDRGCQCPPTVRVLRVTLVSFKGTRYGLS